MEPASDTVGTAAATGLPTCSRGGFARSVAGMPTTVRRSAPVFVTSDLGRALRHYERLGFAVEAYKNGDHYGYACRDGIEIHLARVERVDLSSNTSCAYLWVDDAEALHEEWAAASVDGQLRPPTKTDYGLAEGAHVDPDGNLIRFGSPPLPPRALR